MKVNEGIRLHYPDGSYTDGNRLEIVSLLKSWINSESQPNLVVIIETDIFSISFCVINCTKCVLLMRPENKHEDIRITSNLHDCDDMHKISKSHARYSFSFFPVNIVDMDEAINDVASILADEDTKLHWQPY